jgi:ABC-type Mn2+/Zn2+ transport system permease subunit
MVLPGLSAIQFSLSFRGTTVASIIIGVFGVVFGLLLSVLFDVATSGIIVFTMAGIFLFSAVYNRTD